MPYMPSTFGILFFWGENLRKVQVRERHEEISLVTTAFKSYLHISFIPTHLEHQGLLSQQAPCPRDAKPLRNSSMPNS